LGGRGRQISEFEASLVYKVSSRTARAIQRNPAILEFVCRNRQPNFVASNVFGVDFFFHIYLWKFIQLNSTIRE
jgi:hypothetical protein